jgi:uracil-DNA glycosylase family 4
MPDDGANKRSALMLVSAQMREIEAQVRTCQLCRLAKTRTHAVPGEGDYKAEVMFIGEGPGYHEDRQGSPFVGNAGQFLNELLEIAGLSRNAAFITNVVKCRPPNNRDPNPDEMAACSNYLDRQIALINPRMIVTLGRFSMARFFPGEKISQIHGMARMVEGRLCVAMYHPAAGLHQASLADIIRADFRKLPIIMEQGRRLLAPTQPTSIEGIIPSPEPQPHAEELAPPSPPTPEPPTLHEPSAEYQPLNPPTPGQQLVNAEFGEDLQPPPVTPPQPSTSKKRTKSKPKDNYTQLNFFDL